MDNYHVIVKSTKTNEIVLEFDVTCKLSYLVEHTRQRLLSLGYTYYNITKNLYMIVRFTSNEITSMI